MPQTLSDTSCLAEHFVVNRLDNSQLLTHFALICFVSVNFRGVFIWCELTKFALVESQSAELDSMLQDVALCHGESA